MARLGEKLQPVLSDVAKRIRYDALKAYGKNATELRQALNAPLEFEIIEEIPDGEKSKYAGCTVVLSRPNAPVGGSWTVGLDKNGRASLDATIVGYIQAGLPTQLRLWNKGDDHNEDDPVLIQTFKVTEKVTVIPLGSTDIDVQWFNGNWNRLYSDGTDSGNENFDLSINIIDESNCSFRFNYGGSATTPFRTTPYVFDAKSGRLTLLQTFDAGDVVLTRHGKDDGDYGREYLRTIGSDFVRVD